MLLLGGNDMPCVFRNTNSMLPWAAVDLRIPDQLVSFLTVVESSVCPTQLGAFYNFGPGLPYLLGSFYDFGLCLLATAVGPLLQRLVLIVFLSAGLVGGKHPLVPPLYLMTDIFVAQLLIALYT